MYLFFIWRLALMIFMRANPLLGPLEGVGPENIDFLGPNITKGIALASRVSISGPKKVPIFRATPSSGPRICPHQNHYVPRHIINRYRYINSHFFLPSHSGTILMCA
jgi:hypothetical protein